MRLQIISFIRKSSIASAIAFLFVVAFTTAASAQAESFWERWFGKNETAETITPASEAETPAEPEIIFNKNCPELARETDLARQYPESCGADVPPAEVMSPGPYDGVWEVETHGGEQVEQLFLFVNSKGGPLERLNPNIPSIAHGVWRLKGSDTFSRGKFAVPWEMLEDGRIHIRAGSWGLCNCVQLHWRVRPTGDPNVMVGEWEFDGKKGKTTWRRVTPPLQITSVEISDAYTDASNNWVTDKFSYGEGVGVISRQHPVSCGYGEMQGNCGRIHITIHGEGFAGARRIWIDPAVRMPLIGASWICKTGEAEGTYWEACDDKSSTPGSGVGGIQTTHVLRRGMSPGPINIWVDGVPIPIYLNITGHPDSVDVGEEEAPIKIDDVIVVDNQTSLVYPFNIKNETFKGASVSRRLLIHGENLGRALKNGELPRALGPGVAYRNFGANSKAADAESARAQIEKALEAAGSLNAPDPALISRLQLRLANLRDTDNLVSVEAVLSPGVQSGPQVLSLDEARGAWPLLFGNQTAKINFARYGDQIRDDSVGVFFPLDIGAVDVIPDADIPFDNVGVRLLHRSVDAEADEAAEEVAVLLAKRVDDLASDGEVIFRTDPIYFTSEKYPAFQPGQGDDDAAPGNAIALSVEKGDQIAARLFDPSKLSARPELAIAGVLDNPEELGELWKSALTRVAKCEGVTFDGDPLFALKRSKRFSELAVGELVRFVSPIAFIAGELSDAEKSSLRFNPSVDVYYGDHAAALLIRDEMVELMADPSLIQPIAALADNQFQEIQSLRARALANGADSEPLIKHGMGVWVGKPFWKQPTFGRAFRAFFDPAGWTAEEHAALLEIPLAETLDSNALAKRLKIPPAEAEAWAVSAAQKAAKLQLTNLEKAIGRAQDAGDCNLDELLVVAGQKSEPAVRRITPRLVKKVPFPGTPPTERWEADTLARGYVERLHLAGGAVRALKQYGAIDDAYKAMAVAVLTAGAATGASAGVAALGGSTAMAGVVSGSVMLAGDLLDLGLFGVKDLDRAIESEAFYDFARGASLVIGDDVLFDAEENLQSAELAALGLLPAAMGGAIGLKDLKYAKNIDRGKSLFEAMGKGGRSRIAEFTVEEKVQLAAAMDHAVSKAAASGLESLDSSELKAFEAASAIQRHSVVDAAVDGMTDSALNAPTAPFEDLNTQFITSPLEPHLVGAPESPYRGSLLDRFTKEDARSGELKGTKLIQDKKGRYVQIYEGSKLTIARTGEEIQLGERVGSGGFTDVYLDQSDKDWVIKTRRIPTKDNEAKAVELLTHDSEVGYSLLTSIEDEATYFRTARRNGEPVWVEDPSGDGRGVFITREENLGVEINGKIATNAQERFRYRAKPGEEPGPNRAEALTINLAVRELNQKGIIWTDSKLLNLDVVPSETSPTGYEVVFFDYDGFRPVKGDLPGDESLEIKMWRQARHGQRAVDGFQVAEGENIGKAYWAVRKEVDDTFDHRVYGMNMRDILPMTPAMNKNSSTYDQLNALDVAGMKAEVAEMSTILGKPVIYEPPAH